MNDEKTEPVAGTTPKEKPAPEKEPNPKTPDEGEKKEETPAKKPPAPPHDEPPVAKAEEGPAKSDPAGIPVCPECGQHYLSSLECHKRFCPGKKTG